MSLKLIVGPPNSGRAGEVLARLRGMLDRDPLLLVPTGDDIARFERDLCVDGEPAIGATIRTFASLFDQVVAATATPSPPTLTAPQRLALVRAAIASTPLGVLARSARSRGFAPALDTLIAELQAALISPAELRAAGERDPAAMPAERELAALYASYVELREQAGRSDAGSIAAAAVAALRADPTLWRERPVLIYGFDDLTEVQLELTLALAGACDVTVAVNYEDRDALSARARLLGRLAEEGAEVAGELEFDPAYTASESLRGLAAGLFEPAPESAVDGDGAVRLLDCAGERTEAEAVGIEIARLLAAGASADEIVVVLRRPAAEGPLMASVLREMGIPVTLEADLPLAATAVGRSLISLCRAASEDGEPDDVIAHLRADTAFRAGRADWAERGVARAETPSVEALIEKWGERVPAHLRRVLEAGGPLERVRAVAVSARRLAETVHRERAPLAGERSHEVPLDPIELRAGVAAAELLEELADVATLPGLGTPDLADAAAAIESGTVRSWQGSTEGRVRVLSPYRVRAARVRHLFCCALQEGTFPGRGAADPLLGEEGRRALGIPALRRGDQDDEERYLFYVCVSRPTESLTLTWRSSDEEGRPSARSPFIDEVVDLLGDDAEATEEALTRKRGLAQAVPAVAEATGPRMLARALTAAYGPAPDAHRRSLDSLGCDLATAGGVLELTSQTPDPGWKPGPLSHPEVLKAIGERDAVSAGSLEGWVECSYRWFVNHELAPQRLEPTADPLWLGGLVHDALHQLYLEPPGADLIPRPADAGRWKRRFSELLDELLADPGRAASSPDRRLAVARVRIQVDAFLDEEAERQTDLRPRPELLERSFGFKEVDDDPGALELGGLSLRGLIDRIDVAPDGRRALVRDYKTSKAVSNRAKFDGDGKLQLPLYMLIARERLGLDPVAGLYHPLGAYKDRRGRGIALREECAEGGVLEGAGIATRTKDVVSREELDSELERAREVAAENATRMLAGDIHRDPHAGKCPRYCEFQPICRLERAIGLEDEAEGGGG